MLLQALLFPFRVSVPSWSPWFPKGIPKISIWKTPIIIINCEFIFQKECILFIVLYMKLLCWISGGCATILGILHPN